GVGERGAERLLRGGEARAVVRVVAVLRVAVPGVRGRGGRRHVGHRAVEDRPRQRHAAPRARADRAPVTRATVATIGCAAIGRAAIRSAVGRRAGRLRAAREQRQHARHRDPHSPSVRRLRGNSRLTDWGRRRRRAARFATDTPIKQGARRRYASCSSVARLEDPMLDRARSSISAASAAALLAALAGCGEGAPSAGTASSASASMRAVTFKTSLLGEYVTAEGAGGGDVNANRAIAGTWETFMLYDLNGGDLNHGDLINLQTNNGHFVCAENGGGGIVDANRTAASTWETFRVLKLGGGDAVVRDGYAIALQTEIAGRYVSAIGGGGANVVADRTAIQSWETFLIGLPSSHAGPPAPVSAPPVAPPPSTAPPTRLRITSHCADPIWIAHSDNVGDPQNVQLASGQSYDYQIPSGGLASARFWPKIGCDATGHHCAIGDNGQGGGQPCPANGCQPPIDSKFEVTFAAAGASDQTWYNLSQVDGYTLPFKVAPSGAGVNQGTCVASDCSQLSL